MRFHIGPWRYTVRITDGALFDQQGREAAAMFVPSQRRILISGTLPLAVRSEKLRHELRHAWLHHLGRPTDEETDCDTVASFSACIERQFADQGGESALAAMTAGGALPTRVPVACLGGECCKCQSRFSPAQVVTEVADHSDTLDVLTVQRRLFCDFCGHVQAWKEVATRDGLPTGQVLGQPTFEKGEAVNAFIRKHGETLGFIPA